MEHPLISVVLPIYNVEKYLPVCMKSLLSQTYKNLEIILVDDGSSDGCIGLCNGYAQQDKRVVVYHKQNGGLSDARNYGVEHARGEYIAYVDPDDYVDLDYIEYLYYILKKYNVEMSVCQHRVHFNAGTVDERGKKGDEEVTVSECLKRMLYHDVIDTSAWAKLYHRDLFQTVRYPIGKIYEDTATTYRLMMECDRIAIGYESKYNYIFHENSIINSKFQINKLDLIEATDYMAQNIKKRYPELEEAAVRRQVYARFSILNQMLEVPGYSEIRSELMLFIKKHKKDIFHNKEVPKRDKAGMVLLLLNYRLYKFCWLQYRKFIMGGTGGHGIWHMISKLL
ncbi:glycosyltransferase family 2 protein [uncultured Acetatifactor sp.]|jgi:glycosyltransferase involved in cell wall biosynthesis|uniref:glycosyltransferase family 2 protein n=1 Tax=uncultured Acetatifactor sp. TaxID=1671927 RepID=UPI002622C86A|nr:glycosyltransferase family 2 protein [uncultured Acetatifactor sp.]